MDVLPKVFWEINKWVQINIYASESGEFILGYKHKGTGNISLEFVTCPQALDISDRVNFKIRGP